MSEVRATRHGCQGPAGQTSSPCSNLVFAGSVGYSSRPRLLRFWVKASSLEPSLEFAAIAGTPRIENGGTVAVDFADGRRDRRPLASGLMPQCFGVQLRTGGGTGTTLTSSLRRHSLLGSRFGSSGACSYGDYSRFGFKVPNTNSSKKSDTCHRSASPRQGLYVSCTIHNARRAGNRGKSKRRLETTLVLG
jgi:hypothetical protein